MQKRFYYELMGMAALAILGTLLLVVAVCFSYLNPEYLSEQQREKMILVLMIGIAAIMALCFLLAAIWSHQLGEKLHLGKEVDNELNAKMRQEFTANVSHELKTPLTAISGYSELIENGMISSESEIRRMAGEIHSNSGRLITLINDVIRLSELDEEQEEVLQKIPFLVAAKSCVQMLQINAEKHGVTFTLEGEEVSLWGTRQMVDEVLYNLCDNAIRYNKENGSVTVKVHRQNDCAVLIVQDTGIGIPEECQKRIFERFYRVDKGRSKSTGGTGLGLAIVKHILVRLKGKLSLVSKPGEGTTITIVFPSCEEQ
ncbi:MAG: ATP-binding protein [Lachnospiraceae bacterium]|nr:ATP-binding protein [Lachnospiraceae bacterium]